MWRATVGRCCARGLVVYVTRYGAGFGSQSTVCSRSMWRASVGRRYAVAVWLFVYAVCCTLVRSPAGTVHATGNLIIRARRPGRASLRGRTYSTVHYIQKEVSFLFCSLACFLLLPLPEP